MRPGPKLQEAIVDHSWEKGLVYRMLVWWTIMYSLRYSKNLNIRSIHDNKYVFDTALDIGEERTNRAILKGSLWTSHNSIRPGDTVFSPFTSICQMHIPEEHPGGFCTTGFLHTDWLSLTEILTARLILHFPLMSELISGWPLTHTYWILQPWKMSFYWHLWILWPSYTLT